MARISIEDQRAMAAEERVLEVSEDFEPDWEHCNDPHGIGCRALLKNPAIGVAQPCRGCVWRNFESKAE